MNLTRLTASITERSALRFTPAGLPALDLVIEHVSTVLEAGGERQARLVLKALAIGAIAEQIAAVALGHSFEFRGFLSSPRQGRSVLFHIQDFQQN